MIKILFLISFFEWYKNAFKRNDTEIDQFTIFVFILNILQWKKIMKY